MGTAVSGNSQIASQLFVTPEGNKLLIVNKSNGPVDATLPGFNAASVATVDEATGDNKGRASRQSSNTLHLEPFAVSVVTYR